MTRRQLLLASAPAALRAAEDKPALELLMEGNQRFARLMALHPDQSRARRFSVAMGQHPFATVLTCADSRVPPEVIFDQGLGDLFVIRVAGNIVDDAVLGSIEYAAEHLKVPLVFVLGHERCGAVEAALQRGEAPGHIGALVSAIRPAVETARRQTGDALDNAVCANVRLVAEQIRSSRPILAELVEKRRLTVAGGRYDLETGVVELVD